jgi:molybdenum cofactor cytidylyltransferase
VILGRGRRGERWETGVNTADLQIIVLADGAGTGGPGAQLLPFPNARLLPQVLSHATAVAGHSVTVVLGAHAAEIAPGLGRSPVSLVVNREWSEGIAASIRAGLLSVAGSCAAALLLRADQGAVSGADLQRLADVWRRSPRVIVAAQYGGGYGLPAVFPRAEFPALLRLRGGQGAEALLRSPAVGVIGVPMPSAAAELSAPGAAPGLSAS